MNCIRCNGTKKYLGTGYILTDCDLCLEKEAVPVESKPFLLDKRSKSYRKAVEDIMRAANITKAEAEVMFENECNK